MKKIIVILFVITLSACGVKGPLTLPEENSKTEKNDY